MASGSKSRYITSLDGLRAFAVIVVIFYHLGFSWAPGGLLGVTVFFVLSGYLITSLLLNEWKRTGTIKLKDFWMRRIKRLIPAIIFLLICVAALCSVFNHELLTKMRPDIPPALFFYSNWWYIFHDVSYFDALGAPSPLTHFWSLAIEEQFYLVWPVLLLFLFKAGVRKNTMSKITAVLMVISVLLMAFLYNPNIDPSRVYYGTDTRAFSLLIGALLAFAWPSNQLSEASDLGLSRRGRILFDGVGIASFVGLILLVGFANGFSSFMYRGGIFLASVLTAVVIAVLVHPKSVFAKVMSFWPFVWVGQRSYGMYLWHWPIILLMSPGRIGPPNLLWALLEIAVVFAISEFSFRFIENPIRKGKLGSFVKGIRDHSVNVFSFVQRHIIPASLSIVLVAIASIGLVTVPNTSALENVDALISPSERDYPMPGVYAYKSRIETALAEKKEEPFDILFIGDSVSVRTIPYFEHTFPRGAIDAEVNRYFSEAVPIYENYRNLGLAGDVVVLALGTNGFVDDAQVDEAIRVIGPDKKIYLVTTRSGQEWEQASNEAIHRASERYANVHIIDWFGISEGHNDGSEKDYFDGDDTHLNEEGALAYVEMVRTATGFPEPSTTATPENTEQMKQLKEASSTLEENLLLTIDALSNGFVVHFGKSFSEES